MMITFNFPDRPICTGSPSRLEASLGQQLLVPCKMLAQPEVNFNKQYCCYYCYCYHYGYHCCFYWCLARCQLILRQNFTNNVVVYHCYCYCCYYCCYYWCLAGFLLIMKQILGLSLLFLVVFGLANICWCSVSAQKIFEFLFLSKITCYSYNFCNNDISTNQQFCQKGLFFQWSFNSFEETKFLSISPSQFGSPSPSSSLLHYHVLRCF